MRYFNYDKQHMWWCSRCEIALEKVRCYCCRTLGRRYARHRKGRLSNPKTVFVDDQISLSDQESKRQESEGSGYSPDKGRPSPIFRVFTDPETEPEISDRTSSGEVSILCREPRGQNPNN